MGKTHNYILKMYVHVDQENKIEVKGKASTTIYMYAYLVNGMWF